MTIPVAACLWLVGASETHLVPFLYAPLIWVLDAHGAAAVGPALHIGFGILSDLAHRRSISCWWPGAALIVYFGSLIFFVAVGPISTYYGMAPLLSGNVNQELITNTLRLLKVPFFLWFIWLIGRAFRIQFRSLSL